MVLQELQRELQRELQGELQDSQQELQRGAGECCCRIQWIRVRDLEPH